MDAKKEFYKAIWAYYNDISNEMVPIELLDKLSIRIADYYYEQYNRFRIQYPKSEKRYSSFQIKDLEHPSTYEIIIKFFKEKVGINYSDYSKRLLRMTETELIAFEKNREEFYKMF